MKIPMKAVCNLRLYNIYYLCKSLIEVFSEVKIKATSSEYHIEKWNEYKTALQSLRQVPMFKNTADEIYETIPAFIREKPVPAFGAATKDKFDEKNNNLVYKMQTIIDLYESMNLKDTKKGIDIKIPTCEELKDYIWYLKEINFIFTQCPYLLSEKEQIHFASLDVGSSWISFAIDIAAGTTVTYYILNNLAIILDKVMVLKSHYINIKQQEETLKIIEKKSELADSETEIFSSLKKYYMNEVVSQLEEEIEPLKDGEERGKVEKSLEKLTTLLDKGVEIYASLDTPKDVQVLFPELGETEKLPENVLKFLEDKNKQSNDEE